MRVEFTTLTKYLTLLSLFLCVSVYTHVYIDIFSPFFFFVCNFAVRMNGILKFHSWLKIYSDTCIHAYITYMQKHRKRTQTQKCRRHVSVSHKLIFVLKSDFVGPIFPAIIGFSGNWVTFFLFLFFFCMQNYDGK